jgi:CDP-diacylglycerol---serine O-phosphatidyltransferase
MQRKNLIRKQKNVFLPLSRLFPNMVTITGLCCGLSAIKLAIEARFELAIILLVAAAVIDGLDGRIARFLNATSIFGAHLDSLSDFVCFGVVPAMLIYLWKLHLIKSFGWAVILFFAVCCALRLARFNTNMLDETKQAWENKFFIGIPSPAGAMLLLMPVVSSFYSDISFFANEKFCLFWTVLIGFLMASRVPTFAVKKITIHHEMILPIMLVGGGAIVMTIAEPWFMFNMLGIAYFCTIPLSIIQYKKYEKASKNTA